MIILTLLMGLLYVPGLTDPMGIPRWAALILGAAILFSRVRVVMTPAHWFGFAFLAYSGLSCLWSVNVYDSLGEFAKYLGLAGIFCVAAERRSLQGEYLAIGLVVAVSAAFAIFQNHGYQPVISGAVPAGLFFNKNFFADIAVVAVIVSVGRFWVMTPAALFAVYITQSRGAWIALTVVAVAFMINKFTSRAARLTAYALTGLIVVVAIWGDLYVSQTYGANMRLSSFNDRLILWQITFANIHWFGFGAGTYQSVFPIWQHAHNEALETMVELGVGFIPLMMMVAYAWTYRVSPDRYVLLAVGTLSMVSFTLHQPWMAFIFAMVAGHLSGQRHRLYRRSLYGRDLGLARVAAQYGTASDTGPYGSRGADLSIGSRRAGTAVQLSDGPL